MAWITKNSATMTIERREQPYLTEEIKADLTRRVLPRYETKMAALLPVLHEVQHHAGYLPHQALLEVADFLELTPAQVLDTASFYEEFFFTPVGKYIIGVCQSIACEACGHQEIVDYLRGKLGIEPHETTSDGLFTLRCMECLGACDTAPCALVNEERHDLITIEQMGSMIDEIRARESGRA
ncbi:MAG: NADH-quinone oxidoreductase subunit NuoE [Phycisphaerales bacterium]|nr:NADH-quinone oxidoreductase subunit NuoE [Phycisphaerales bacterium]